MHPLCRLHPPKTKCTPLNRRCTPLSVFISKRDTFSKKKYPAVAGYFFLRLIGNRTRGLLARRRGRLATRGGLRRSAGRFPPSPPRRRGLHIVRDDFFMLRGKSHLSLIPSLLLPKTKPRPGPPRRAASHLALPAAKKKTDVLLTHRSFLRLGACGIQSFAGGYSLQRRR